MKTRQHVRLLFLACMLPLLGHAQVTLTTSPYTQNFNGVASGLPPGWTGRTGATASAPGADAGFTVAAVTNTATTGQFGNFTSQDATRCMGVRQTGAFGDPGAAFVLQLANTTGASNLAISFTLMDLANQPRSTTWNVDYGIGTSPTTWTNLTTSPASLITGGTGSDTYAVTATLPAAVNNSAQNVWVRIASKSASTGSGNRTSTAIDNFSLSFTTATAPVATFTQLSAGMAASPLGAGSADQALFGFSASSTASGSTAPTTQAFTALTVPTTSNSNGVLTNVRLIRSTDANPATTGDNTVVGTFTQNAGSLTLTGLSEALNGTAKNYYIVANVTSTVTVATPTLRLSLSNTGTALSGGTQNTYTYNGTVYNFMGSASPSLIASSVDPFGSVCINSELPPTGTFTVTGSNLTAGNVQIGPLTGFAFFDANAFDYVPTLSIPQSGTLDIEVSVRFLPTATQVYTGAIPVAGGGASTSVAVSGTGVNSTPVSVTGTASGIGLNTATATGTLSAAGCSDPSVVGIEYSTTNNFIPGTGTQVPAASVGDAWSVDLADLEPCRTYYFRAYATNSGGTHHGDQSSFATSAPAPPVANAATGIFSTGATANWEAVPGVSDYELDVSTLPAFAVQSFATDLFISEYGEGSGSNKYIEVYNGTGSSVNLASYSLRLYSNLSTSISAQTALSGTLPSGATIVFKNGSAAWPGDAIAFNTVINFNGDDAFALAKNGTNIDLLGVIGSGSAYGTDVTLVRKPAITQASTTYVAAQWDTYPSNTTSTLGTHTSVVPSSTPSFLPGYAALPVSGTSHAITGLTLGQTYYYRVRAVMGTCESVSSSTISVIAACDNVVIADLTSNSPICSVDALALAVSVASGETPYSYAWQGAGVFSPNTSSADVSVSAAVSGNYSVTVTNSCSADNASLDVDATPDTDGDGVCDDTDGCANDPAKTAPGICGCGVADVATTYYADTDGDGFGDPASPVAGYTCTTPNGAVNNSTDGCPNDGNKQAPGVCGCGVADADSDGDGLLNCMDNCPNLPGQQGSPCTVSGSPGIINALCQCALLSTCTENVTMELRTDALSSQASWQILAQNTNTVLCEFSVPIDGITGPIPQDCCLPVGCYRLRVTDSGGDGFVSGGITGGYLLRETSGGQRRIIDNTGNFSNLPGGPTDVSAVASTYENGAFCLPIGNNKPVFQHCDKLDWANDQLVALVATEDPLVSASWNATTPPTDKGYEFWWFDPNGTYSFRRFRSHAASDGYSPANATRACKVKINGWSNTPTSPWLTVGKVYNVRIRARYGATSYSPFGPACLFKIDPAAAAHPSVKLQDNPANTTDYSCGVIRQFGGGNSGGINMNSSLPGSAANWGNKIVATPPQPIPAVASANVRYQFRFINDGEYPAPGSCIIRPPQVSPTLYLNWTTGDKLICGVTYSVDVRVSLDNGATWHVGGNTSTPSTTQNPRIYWGPVCSVSMKMNNNAHCPANGLAGGSTNLVLENGDGNLTMYPNPNRGDQLFISLSEVATDVHTVSVDIFDMTGKRVAARILAVQYGFLKTALDLNGELTSGMYLINIIAGDKTYNERLVIQP